eukprot:m.64492 g.64492  ORF g.64492 m.64492 type:complete len:335 (+) comp13595_c0_seq3:65-1069(+)
MAAQAAGSVQRRDTVDLRVIYNGQTLRNGRLVELVLADGESVASVSPASVLACLEQQEWVDLERFAVLFYHKAREGWVSLHPDCERLDVSELKRLEIKLEDRTLWRGGVESRRGEPDAEPGFFGIGIYRNKSEANHGTLWRTAYQMGASFVFTIGARFDKSVSRSTDTMKSWVRLPVFSFPDFASFAGCAPYAAPWVGVEMGGQPLTEFEHPPRAVYILGAEDTGLPASIRSACAHTVALPAVRASSFNVSVAAAIVMYDRLAKRGPGACGKATLEDLAAIVTAAAHTEVVAENCVGTGLEAAHENTSKPDGADPLPAQGILPPRAHHHQINPP